MKDNLKRLLCNKLIKENLVQEGDCIRHSYSTNRLNKMYTQNSVDKDTSPTLDTRCDCLGVVVKDMSYVSEKYKKFIKEKGYIPEMFCPYNDCEIKDCAKTVTTQCGSTTSSATCLIKENEMIINPLKDKSPYGWHFEQNVYDVNGETRSVKASQGSGNMLKIIEENEMENNLRIRKLTPKECFRLMGVKDEDSDKLNHLSNATKYHLAGDSIVVNVLQAIFKSILIDNPVAEEKPIRLIEFFAGYGSQALALKYLGIPFEHWKTCEWAVKSINAYRYIHFPEDYCYNGLLDLSKEEIIDYLYKKGISSNWNEPMKLESIKRMKTIDLYQTYEDIYVTNNLVNIQQVHAEDLEIKERDNYNYILTYSFPCQDLSLAGKTAGMKKGSGTRSGMLWEVERILEECGEELPQILLMENVPQVVGKKNKEDFDNWVSFLESKGYTNKYCMLNAKEVGYPEPIPQNRNRCFMISVLNPKCDIVFPEKTERTKVLKDLLEGNVDEKYYLSDSMINYIKADNEKWTGNNDKAIINKSIASTLNTNEGSRRCDASNYISTDVDDDYNLKDVNRLYGIFDNEKGRHQAGSVYDRDGLSPTLDTMQGGYRQPLVEEDTEIKTVFIKNQDNLDDKWSDLD